MDRRKHSLVYINIRIHRRRKAITCQEPINDSLFIIYNIYVIYPVHRNITENPGVLFNQPMALRHQLGSFPQGALVLIAQHSKECCNNSCVEI